MGKLLILKLLLVVSILGLAVEFKIIYSNHPILLKWLLGEANIIGKPLHATVYTDNHVTKNINVYTVRYPGEKRNDYLLSLKEADTDGMLKFILIEPNDQWVGRSVSSAKDSYDSIASILFQDDVGAHFVNFRDDMKGFAFDPQLTFTDGEIKFNMPPQMLKYNSVKIELNTR